MMDNAGMNYTAAPKTGTFQMRINPDMKQKAESVFAAYGLTLTDAVNIFIQQSLNMQGLPFLLSPENREYLNAKATQRLMSEIDKGWASAEAEGWLTLDEVEARLGISHE